MYIRLRALLHLTAKLKFLCFSIDIFHTQARVCVVYLVTAQLNKTQDVSTVLLKCKTLDLQMSIVFKGQEHVVLNMWTADMNLKFTGEALRFQRERKVKYVLGLGHQATVHNYIKKCLKKLDKCFQVDHFCHKSLPGK